MIKNCFENRVKLGEVGERIVTNSLIEKGYIPYQPAISCKHWVDMFAHNVEQNKIVCIEVKTKPKMRNYNATGIDIDHLRDYLKIIENFKMDVLLFFVDAAKKEIYFGNLTELMQPKTYHCIDYPNFKKSPNKILFPLEELKILRKLTDAELTELKKYSLS